jgi:hypothetical protein
MSYIGVTLKLDEINENDGKRNRTFEPIPEGLYLAKITKAETKQAKSGGTYLSVEFTISGGKFADRKVWTNFTITSKSETAERIGRAQLKALCLAIGVFGTLEDTRALLAGELAIEVYIRPAENGFKARNEISEFYNMNDIEQEEEENPGNVLLTDDEIPF